ncbi:hypothetical protein BDP27DRAFT_1491210 [Rhodocollybia butyracea]|uniref:Uncharacterized protein n=1 Tax=Rhodocollybia butyracea TaxID=206335 RepID=A0A9P5TZX2_9AGAR|nr:hypothetical protein BDP27DRAFT_1491210 [Rhodocollybia butyracea]
MPAYQPLQSYNWDQLDEMDPQFSGSRQAEEIQALSDYMLGVYEYGPDNIDSDEEPPNEASDGSDSETEDLSKVNESRGDDAFNPNGLNHKRPRTTDSRSREWFPWNNRTECTIDILMHLPRSVFSTRQLDLFLWMLKVSGVDDTPSVKKMNEVDKKLQTLYGIQTIKYKGALGHTYYTNSLADIISQEMANPRVRPHLSFYPEAVDQNLSEARQFAHWLHEIPDDEMGPMLRVGSVDYYIFEPAMLRSGKICMPHRWFMHGPRHYVRCWAMEEVVREGVRKSWRVVQGGGEITVGEEELLKNFPQLLSDTASYPGFENVSNIEDSIDISTTPHTVENWKLTNPVLGNPWRERANGAPCLSFPIWLYCDDTSGNTSKKWNKHNSFLFTAAGLPRAESSKEYNIHFLSTSNIAPPLEMLDGISDQMSDAQEHGIWAWDCVTESKVLLIPCVLALLGDNPMQSEFACHIGLWGKFFCRVCGVKGKDSKAEDSAGRSGNSTPDKKTGKGRRKFKEGLAAMTERVKAFVKPGTPRVKAESIQILKTQFLTAQSPGLGSKIKEMRTIISDLPPDTMSPVWRLRGLDPHSDTPVEILHVILLGFVKYLWRDAIENQIKKNPEKQKELIIRLSSLDVDGLGLDSKLAGATLVNHYGSLTGSDFRKVAQVAPFILKDFVSADCYATWVALSKLIPLIWQPEILELKSYLTTLENEIQHFLLCVGHWTIRWFNKPKFHILVHLPEHIRRFGPAMLFATEGFESFNAVIRAQSVHSNRQAPSRDIAIAFAKQNRLRHMLSGALFLDRDKIPVDPEGDQKFLDTCLPQTDRVTVNQRYYRFGVFDPDHLMKAGPSTVELVDHSLSTCTLDSSTTAQKWQNTFSGRHVPMSPIFEADEKSNATFHRAKDLVLENLDKCMPGSYVACQNIESGNAVDGVEIAQVKEVLWRYRPDTAHKTADAVLLEGHKVGPQVSVHGMPRLLSSNSFHLVEPEKLLCTVNTQHDCSRNPCTIEHDLAVRQEQEQTVHLKGRINHRGNVQDLVLNTAQMRDAKYVQRFRIAAQPLVSDHILQASAVREWDAENPKAKVPERNPLWYPHIKPLPTRLYT